MSVFNCEPLITVPNSIVDWISLQEAVEINLAQSQIEPYLTCVIAAVSPMPLRKSAILLTSLNRFAACARQGH